jgi:hypothetical protein
MTATLEVPKRVIEHRGSVFKLRKELEAVRHSSDVLEYLVEGPRGTGKSNAYLLWKFCRNYKNAAAVIGRRSLLTDTPARPRRCAPGTAPSQVQRTAAQYLFLSGSRIVVA